MSAMFAKLLLLVVRLLLLMPGSVVLQQQPSAASSSSSALDPEETLFAFTRCAEQYSHSEDGDSSSSRLERIRRWTSWELEPVPAEDDETKCFVACLLTKLKLWQPFEGRFSGKQIVLQHDLYSTYVKCSRAEAEELARSVDQIGDDVWNCASAYEAFRRVVYPRIHVFKQLFLMVNEVAARVYEDLGPLIRQPNQSYFQLCEQKFYKDRLDIWCTARSYSIPDDENFHMHMDCIFRGLRYYDNDDVLNIIEILRDFHQVGITDIDDEITNTLVSCEVETGREALMYYRCLLESSFVEQFKEALDYREIRSKDYYYGLRDPTPNYSREVTQRQVNAIHQVYCKNFTLS